MPISLVCTQCAKKLKVPDDWAGRRAKCPGCKASLVVPAGAPLRGAAAAGGAHPEIAARAASRKAPVKEGKGLAIAINTSIAIYLGIALLIVATGLVLYFGPARVNKQWEAMRPKVTDEVTDVMDRAIKSQQSMAGLWDANKSVSGAPHVIDLEFQPFYCSMSMPETIGFVGTTPVGTFSGKYHTDTHEVESNLGTDGYVLSSNVIIRKPNNFVQVTGRTADGKLTVELDGKPAAIGG